MVGGKQKSPAKRHQAQGVLQTFFLFIPHFKEQIMSMVMQEHKSLKEKSQLSLRMVSTLAYSYL